MQKLKHNAHLVVIIAILFVTGFSFASAFRSQSNPFVSVVSADDDEDDREEAEDDREDDSDNDRDEDEDERDNEDEDNNDDEDEQITTTRTRTATQVRTQEADENEDENEIDEDENEDAEEVKEDISELNQDIRKVELRISVLASSGVAVDTFNASLGEVKDLVSQAEALVVSNPKGIEDILEIAKYKLERVEKLVKISLKDDDEDEESTEEALEEISELRRDIAKIGTRLSLASSRGIDVAAYLTIIGDAKAMLAQAEAKLSAGNYIEAESLAELAGKKLDRIDDIFEDEDEVSDEYKSEVALFVHNLKAIGEIEGGIGRQVSVVAKAQNDAQPKVEGAIADVSDRNEFMKFLVGPKYGSLSEIQTAVAENQTRINVLAGLTNQMTDPVVKQVLQDQIIILTQQNTNLQKFVTESEDGFSMFGWLVKMFS